MTAAKKILPFLLLPVIINLLSRNNPFFIDTGYHSSVAQWLYEKGLRHIFLPLELDAGHPPFFALYLASIWKIFAKTLLVSHLAVLPFAIGIYWQLFRLIVIFFKGNSMEICLLLVAFEPTLLAQCTMVSYDLAIVFFYLLGLNALLNKNSLLLFIALLGIGLISIRGLIALPALFLTNWVFNYGFFKSKVDNDNSNSYLFLAFMTAGMLIFAWYFTHFKATGWWLFSNTFASQRQNVNIGKMLWNAGIIGWRLLDFGRLGLWLVFLFSVPLILKTKFYKDLKFQRLSALALAPLLVFSLCFIPFSNPIGHKYYLVFYLLFTLVVSYVITRLYHGWKKGFATGFILIMLLSGHFWVYPDNIAKGWDSSLAHLPYFSLRISMIKYINEKDIAYSEIGTCFPNQYSLKETNLSQDNRYFAPLDLQKNQYVFQSNIMNGFSDNELDELKSKWKLLKEYKKALVYVRLYKKN